jgi:uncharacterized membrane protein YfcA
MTVVLFITLIGVGMAGGICGSAVGIASLASYPALLALGMPPVTANITTTFANIVSGISSVFASSRELHGHWSFVLKVWPLLLSGSIVGALLLFAFPQSVFQRVVPFFILLAAFLMLIPKGERTQQEHSSFVIFLSWAAIFFTGIYSGYFGAASGVIMLALFNIITGEPYKIYNAEKNVAMTGANLTSLVVYFTQTKIVWSWIFPMAIGSIIGGYVGPAIVRHLPDRLVKIVVAIAAVILAGTLAYQAYF